MTEIHRREFEVLRRAFLAEVPGKIRAIRDAAEDAERRGYPRDAVENLLHLTHRLLGSAAIFGLGIVSDASRALEQQVTTLCRPGEIQREGQGRELCGLVQGLESAWSRASRADELGSSERDV
jgi:HPt (histidine-containing phosphotransfer) domain-containing protein